MSRMPPVKTRRFTRTEYDRLVQQGFFDDERLDLLDGQLVVKEPQGSRHADTVVKIAYALDRAFGRRFHVRQHAPVALDDLSEPEPDVAVVRGRVGTYVHDHPAKPVLVVEVADSSLSRDRLRKAALYARGGLVEYWLVNLLDDVVEVYRDPQTTAASRWQYRGVRLLRHTASVAPLAAAGARVRVSDLLP